MYRHGVVWAAIFCVMALMFMRLPQMAAKQDAVVNTYSALVEVDALAKQKYVESIEGDRLVHGAIRGMLFQLDPYSGFIAPGELPAFERRSSGDYIGIGIEVGMRGDMLTVIAPIEGSPAAKAGMLPGDLILSINGQDIEGLSVFDVEKLLSGPPGSAVILEVKHEGQRAAKELAISRGPVNLVTVRGFRRNEAGRWEYMIDRDSRIGYVRVSNFLHNTLRDFDKALANILDRDARGLVIDLRFNPGGMMHQAIGMVDRFVDRGAILSTVTRRKAVKGYAATAPGTNTAVKLAVLVNSASASSSEIVAGSLQAHRRAVIVGERSFGKGSVQHLIYLTDARGAIKLTTSYYRLPDGRIVHRTRQNTLTDSWGVIPDIVITLSEEERLAIPAFRRVLDRGFAYPPSSAITGDSAIARHKSDAAARPEILRDRQLLEALSALRTQVSGPITGG